MLRVEAKEREKADPIHIEWIFAASKSLHGPKHRIELSTREVHLTRIILPRFLVCTGFNAIAFSVI